MQYASSGARNVLTAREHVSPANKGSRKTGMTAQGAIPLPVSPQAARYVRMVVSPAGHHAQRVRPPVKPVRDLLRGIALYVLQALLRLVRNV